MFIICIYCLISNSGGARASVDAGVLYPGIHFWRGCLSVPAPRPVLLRCLSYLLSSTRILAYGEESAQVLADSIVEMI